MSSACSTTWTSAPTPHFDKEAQVLRAPELDDLDDTDNLVVMRLAGPSVSERHTDPLSA